MAFAPGIKKCKKKKQISPLMQRRLHQMADEVLRSILKEEWSDLKKARAIYAYVQEHCSYVADERRPDWRIAAYRGFCYGEGDCYTSYAMSRILLSKAGLPRRTGKHIPSQKMRGRAGHWWNEVKIRGKWRHFDPTFAFSDSIFVR